MTEEHIDRIAFECGTVQSFLNDHRTADAAVWQAKRLRNQCEELIAEVRRLRQLNNTNGPKQKRGRSKQDYATPHEFVRAVEVLIGERFLWDLAASPENAKAQNFITKEQDALKQNWSKLSCGFWCWLNPPFANIEPWAEKCKLERRHGTRIVMLTPASIGTEWFAKHVDGNARVLGIRPRITFVGEKDPYPKDLMLTVWADGYEPKFVSWDWRFGSKETK